MLKNKVTNKFTNLKLNKTLINSQRNNPEEELQNTQMFRPNQLTIFQINEENYHTRRPSRTSKPTPVKTLERSPYRDVSQETNVV